MDSVIIRVMNRYGVQVICDTLLFIGKPCHLLHSKTDSLMLSITIKVYSMLAKLMKTADG